MAPSGKRCLYEVLGLTIDCAADEIRTAYKKMALQRHPDKLVKSGLSHDEATAQFQELVNAYEVLSDPKERAWYDSHRSQILFSNPVSSFKSVVPDLFPYFSNSVFSGYGNTSKGFYTVYSSVFDKIYATELNFAKKLGGGLLNMVKEAPSMGNLECPYSQVTAFYNYWSGFCTVMDFCWVDQYDVKAGPDRKTRRLMEDDNRKTRKKAKREYNDTVRGLAEFVKKRDKRVFDMQVKKALEMEKKRELEKEKKRVLEEEKLRRAMAYEEPEWTKIKEKEEVVVVVDDEYEENEKRNEFYCVVCGKKFKSEKQWKNHEQSKKHKEKVAELRAAYAAEMKERARNEEVSGSDIVEDIAVDDPCVAKNSSSGDEQAEVEDVAEASDVGSNDIDDQSVNITTNDFDALDSEDEVIDLESMLAGRKNRKKAATTNQPHTENQKNEEASGSMEYNNSKTTAKTKGARRAKGKKSDADFTRVNDGDNNGRTTENNGSDSLETRKNTSDSDGENGTDGQDQRSENNHNKANRFDDKKINSKKERGMKSKSKGVTKNSGNLCDACGEDFGSKNKLHRHLGDTGHASLKHR